MSFYLFITSSSLQRMKWFYWYVKITTHLVRSTIDSQQYIDKLRQKQSWLDSTYLYTGESTSLDLFKGIAFVAPGFQIIVNNQNSHIKTYHNSYTATTHTTHRRCNGMTLTRRLIVSMEI